jgi:hypothetical protein
LTNKTNSSAESSLPRNISIWTHDRLRVVPPRKPLPSHHDALGKKYNYRKSKPLKNGKCSNAPIGNCQFDERPQESHDKLSKSWLPFFLRKTTLGIFIVIFGAMIIALEVLFVVSKKRDGLTETNTSFKYLWKYGPTATLTIVAAFWGRLKYEAEVTTPCLGHDNTPVTSNKHALLKDYVGAFPIVSPFRAIGNRDYYVAGGEIISLLLTALVILPLAYFHPFQSMWQTTLSR